MQYTVRPGDTLYQIAQLYGLNLAQLLAANPMINDPDFISVGQQLYLPVVYINYSVQQGDSLYLIAQRFGVTLRQLLNANPLIGDPNMIFVGQDIRIPRPIPTDPIRPYAVQPGDTLYNIAKKFTTSLDAILELNPSLTDPDLIYPGQNLEIPTGIKKFPDGCLAYISDDSGNMEVWLTDPLENNNFQITQGKTPINGLKWSPDSQYLGFLNPDKELIVVTSCGQEILQINQVDFFDWHPAGDRIAYSNRNGTYLTNLDGDTTKVTGELYNPVFKDKNSLVGYTLVEDLNYSVMASVDITGDNFKTYLSPIVPSFETKISPNGRYALNQLRRGFPFLNLSTGWVYDFETNRLNQLPGFNVEVNNGYFQDLSFIGGWSPDSKYLAYTTLVSPEGLGEVRIASNTGQIIEAYVVGYNPKVTFGPYQDWVVFTINERPEDNSPRNIYILNWETGQEIRVDQVSRYSVPDWISQECPECQ